MFRTISSFVYTVHIMRSFIVLILCPWCARAVVIALTLLAVTVPVCRCHVTVLTRQVVAGTVAALLADVRRGRRAATHGAVRAQLGSRRAGGAGGLAV